MRTERMNPRIIVGAAIIEHARVLACARADPPELAGRWEFPGGKIEPGETDVAALIRECDEELGVGVRVGRRVGPEVPLRGGELLLRVYIATLLPGTPRPRALEHLELRWLGADQLYSVDWLPGDAPIVAALHPLLRAGLRVFPGYPDGPGDPGGPPGPEAPDAPAGGGPTSRHVSDRGGVGTGHDEPVAG